MPLFTRRHDTDPPAEPHQPNPQNEETDMENTQENETQNPAADPAAAVLPLDDPARAQDDRDRAAELRQRAEAVRAEARTAVEDARAQAARLVADAEARARTLANEANAAERHAADFDAHAALVDHARKSGNEAAAAAQRVLDLAAERAKLQDRIAELDGRLAGLAGQTRDTAAEIEQAREAGDVDRLATARTRAASLEEVRALTTGQRNTAQARAGVIGDLGWHGELDEAIRAAKGARNRAEELLDKLDPTRLERRQQEIFQNTAAQLREANPNGAPEAAAALLTLFATQPDLIEALKPEPAAPAPRQVVTVSSDGRTVQITR